MISEISATERDAIIAAYLKTTEGKRRFKKAFQNACIDASQKFQRGSTRWYLGRLLGGLYGLYTPKK